MTSTMWLARRWWLVPVLVIVTAGSIATNLGRDDLGHDPGVVSGVLAAVLAAATAATLFLLDRWPAAVLATGALFGAYFAVGGQNGPIFFTLVVASFLLPLRRTFSQWFPLLLGASVLCWAGLTIRGLRWDEPAVGMWQSIGIGALAAAGSAVGTALRVSGAERAARADRVAVEERLRMAQDLHDGVGHGLAVIAMQAGVALHVLDRDPGKARESLEAIRDTSRESLAALRAELAAMGTHPGDAATVRRPAAGLSDLPALLERVRAAGLRVEVSGDPGPVPEAVGEVAYVVVQEALTNVLRHAAAESALVAWTRHPDRLVLVVSDDGRGGPVHDEGMGISGMRARVSSLGGVLRVGPRSAGPRSAGGFEVVAELPA